MTQDEIIEMADKAFDESSVTDAEVIRFAELIVRECMSNLYLNGYDDAMIQIQKHFGVEE